MANLGRVTPAAPKRRRRRGPALVFLFTAAACQNTPPKVIPESPVTVGEVRLDGFEVLPAGVREDFATELPLRAGATLTDEAEKAAGERAVEVLQNHGRPYAQVGIAREPIDAATVRVILRADPGTAGFFGPVDIAGNRHVDDRIIRRRVAYAPGDPFSRTAIELTQQRIGSLGLFKSVEIRARDIDARPAMVPTVITVVEQTPWQWNLGLGYAAGERLAVDARISHLNAFGSARRIDVQGRLSSIERSLETAFTQADTWHPALSLSLQARHQEIDEQAFFVLSRGAQGAATWRWTRALTSTVSYAIAREESDVDPSLVPLVGLQDGLLNAWALDLDDRRFTPSAAPLRTILVHVEQAGGWMPGTFNYVSAAGEARNYQSTFGGRLLLATRLRAGSIDPMGDQAGIPMLKRFFLGGSNEMRGWGVYELSPLSMTGEPAGGTSVLTATAEARVPIFKRLRAAVFVEAGNVWQDPWTLRLRDLHYDAGPGVRFDTPFGLIRVDFGYQLRPLEGLRIDGQPQRSRWRFNLGIGEAF